MTLSQKEIIQRLIMYEWDKLPQDPLRQTENEMQLIELAYTLKLNKDFIEDLKRKIQ